MSKILNAVQRAEHNRQVTATGEAPQHLNGLKQELQAAIQHAEETLGQEGVPPGPLAARAGAAPAAQGNGTARVIQASAAAPASTSQTPAMLAHAIEQVTRQLEECERQAARQAAEQVRMNAQLAAGDELISRLTHERLSLRERLADAQKTTASLEAAKAWAAHRLAALHECETLAHAVTIAEQALQANTIILTQLTQAQQRTTDELATYRKRGEALERQFAELGRKLAQALAATSAAEAAHPQTTRSGS